MGVDTERLIVMNASLLSHHQSIGNAPCNICDKDFVLFDRVISRIGSRKRRNYFHESCWESGLY